MKQWCRKHVLLISCALAIAVLLPLLLAVLFAPHKAESGTLTWQYFRFVLRSEWPVICALLVSAEGLLFSIRFLCAPKRPAFPDSKAKRRITLVFLILQLLLLLGVAVIPYIVDELTPTHGWINLFSGFYVYFLVFLCLSPVLIAIEALVFSVSFRKLPLKQNKTWLAFHIVNAILAIVIFALTLAVPDFLTMSINWIPASVILILWLIEFAMRRNLKKRKETD